MRTPSILPLIIVLAVFSGCAKNNATEPDTEAPKVSITFPVTGGILVSDTTYTITATASDDKGVTAVDFYINSVKVATDNSAPYEYTWSTTGALGGYSIAAKASDAAGNTGSSASSDILVVSSLITKSPKRGIAFDLASAADMAALAKGVSWWYNWGKSYNQGVLASYYLLYGMDYIPMLWGGNTSASDMAAVKTFILAQSEIKYLLVMNEPNLTSQANRTPEQAAADWLKYEQVVTDLAAQGRTVYIVGPAITWGTMTGYSDPVVWLDAFYAAFQAANGRAPRIDYLAFHWYDYGLASQLDRLKKYGKRFWVTEMANWNSQINSYVKQEAQMTDMVNTCETRTDVVRYAWFYGRGTLPDSHFTYLLAPGDGQLSELGKFYVNLPYTK
jgi:hypothetical protein